MEYFRKGEQVPERHKTLIENNLMNINKVKQTLEILSKPIIAPIKIMKILSNV